MPPKIYLLITSFRIDGATTLQTFHAAIREAAGCGVPVMIVASIVEAADEEWIARAFGEARAPAHVTLGFVRIPGTGKREALAQGFRAISRDMPPPGALAAVIDGDTLLTPGLLRKCAPFFALMPRLGALTTDEICRLEGSATMRAWHNMRFAQRHLQMCSLALSRRVMTLTGRMSMFRAEIVTDPGFIAHMTGDHLDHWRLGRFRFLTGDDKSSLYWTLARGYEQIYVPDARIVTLEHPPARGFIAASSRLMFRWFGNMLRTNARVLRLGPLRMPLFVWWSFLDQRISMWTSLTGPAFALMLAARQGGMVLLYYMAWIGFTRWIMTLLLLTARPQTDWRYPFLLYYNQLYGALLKTYVLFRLDRQSWTRQDTRLERGLSAWRARAHAFSSAWMHMTALALFICAVGAAGGYFHMPLSGR
jgi:glycosyltransferase Alg8